MESTMTGQRVGVLRLEHFDTAARPIGVTLRNDGFWDGPGWLTPGASYQLAFDGKGWRVISPDWTPTVAAHDWRLANRAGTRVGSLLLETGSHVLDTRATYTIETDPNAGWVLVQHDAPNEPAPL